MTIRDYISGGVTEMIHGMSVPDPYRSLEDRTCFSTQSWLAHQRELCNNYFLRLGPLDHLRSRVHTLLNVESIDQIGKVAQQYFYRRRAVGQQQASIIVTNSIDRTEKILVDPSSLGAFATVGIHHLASDGALLAYELKSGGEHTKAIHIVDVKTSFVLPDHLERGLARGFAFHNGNAGFYYCHDFSDRPSRLPQAHQIRTHRMGTVVEDDSILLSLPRTASSKLVLRSNGDLLGALLHHIHDGAGVVDFYESRKSHDGSWRCVFRNVPVPFGPIFYRARLFVQRYSQAPNGEIVELNLVSGEAKTVVVPEWIAPIKQITIAGGRFYVNYSVETESVVRIWSIEGDYLGTLPLEPGYSWDFFPSYSTEVDEIFLRRESFATPPTVLSCSTDTGILADWPNHRPLVAIPVISSENVRYRSADGTEINMTLIAHGSRIQRRTCSVVMTAYGGFGVSMTPHFSVLVTALLELGFVYALPQIRGGGEHGVLWSESARARNRQVAIDDFIAAAIWMGDNGIAEPERLCIFGACNGGLLVGAAVTQRPDLFSAVLCIAPLLDMVRYEQFDRAHIWSHEYGTIENPDDFHALRAYSPYHNVRDETNYPAMLFVTGDKDTRCNPAHALKMAARLQNRPAQLNPILVDYSAERGHSPAMPTSVRVEAITNRVAFLCRELGITWGPGGHYAD